MSTKPSESSATQTVLLQGGSHLNSTPHAASSAARSHPARSVLPISSELYPDGLCGKPQPFNQATQERINALSKRLFEALQAFHQNQTSRPAWVRAKDYRFQVNKDTARGHHNFRIIYQDGAGRTYDESLDSRTISATCSSSKEARASSDGSLVGNIRRIAQELYNVYFPHRVESVAAAMTKRRPVTASTAADSMVDAFAQAAIEERDALERQKRELDRREEELRTEREALNERASRLAEKEQRDVEALQKERAAIEERDALERQKKELDGRAGALEAAERKNAEGRAALEKQAKELERREEEVARAKKMNAEAQANLEKQAMEFQKELDKQAEAIQNELGRRVTEVQNELGRRAAEVEKANEAVLERIKKDRVTLEEHEKALENKQRELEEREKAEIEKEEKNTARLAEKLHALEQREKKNASDLANLTEQLMLLDTERTKLKRREKELQEGRAELDRQTNAIEGELRQRDKALQERDNMIASMQGALTTERQIHEERPQRSDTALSTFLEKSHQKQKLKKIIADWRIKTLRSRQRREIETLQRTHEEALRALNDEDRATAIQIRHEIQGLQDEIGRLHAENTILRVGHEADVGRIAGLEQQHAADLEQIARLTQERDALVVQLEQAKNEISQLKGVIEEQRGIIRQQEQKIQHLKTQIEYLNGTINQLKEKLNYLNRELEALQNQKTELELKLHANNLALEKTQRTILELRQEIEKVKRENVDLRKQITELTKQNAVDQKLSDITKYLTDLDDALGDIPADLRPVMVTEAQYVHLQELAYILSAEYDNTTNSFKFSKQQLEHVARFQQGDLITRRYTRIEKTFATMLKSTDRNSPERILQDSLHNTTAQLLQYVRAAHVTQEEIVRVQARLEEVTKELAQLAQLDVRTTQDKVSDLETTCKTLTLKIDTLRQQKHKALLDYLTCKDSSINPVEMQTFFNRLQAFVYRFPQASTAAMTTRSIITKLRGILATAMPYGVRYPDEHPPKVSEKIQRHRTYLKVAQVFDTDVTRTLQYDFEDTTQDENSPTRCLSLTLLDYDELKEIVESTISDADKRAIIDSFSALPLLESKPQLYDEVHSLTPQPPEAINVTRWKYLRTCFKNTEEFRTCCRAKEEKLAPYRAVGRSRKTLETIMPPVAGSAANASSRFLSLEEFAAQQRAKSPSGSSSGAGAASKDG